MKLEAAMQVMLPFGQLSTKSNITVCVDFDGVLAGYTGYLGRGEFGKPNEKSLAMVKLLQQKGFRVVVLTARQETDLVSTWLRKQGVYNVLVTNTKPPAIAYVDDNAILWQGQVNPVLQKILDKAVRFKQEFKVSQ